MFKRPLALNLLTKNLMFLLPLAFSLPGMAKEGMWIPATLKAHEKDMRAMGLEIPVEKIYNENGTGLNNAVVLFGKGCTGELVSSKGLILTNHHCGYGSVQGLSSPLNDYFAHGFWAMSNSEELPCPGLTVTFIRRMENVTDKILAGVSDTLNDATRDSIVAIRISKVEKEFARSTGMDATIKPYFEGNQFWVAITETYRDIRLVGFPPNGIGAFGGDDENWMWPRHTGDFSVFRVYANKDNKPADYSAGNQAYHTESFFNINVAGYKEGDFTMVYGFPGTTREYISSYELKQTSAITDPISIEARTLKLKVWSEHMTASRDVFLKYTSKRAGIANGWKKWQGELEGLEANDVTEKKKTSEKYFRQWANVNNELPWAVDLLPQIHRQAKSADPLMYEEQYNREAVLGIELIQQASAADRMTACFNIHLSDSALSDTLKKIVKDMGGFYKNYDAPTDRDVFIKLMPLYFKKCADNVPAYYMAAYNAHNKNFTTWADDIYTNSLFTSQEKLSAFAAYAKNDDLVKLTSDPVWQLYNAITITRKEKLLPGLKNYYTRMHYLDRLYMRGQMEMHKDKTFYPDANLTLRVAYGKVKGMTPDVAKEYSFQTHLSDVVALDDATSDIFRVPSKLKDLYRKKDYGRWGVNGTMPVAFIASNHTSGGNSGSPVLNGRGELIGTNFDRAYEGTMSDYYFDPSRCRNISVDIRYTLFIIDKFGGAGWLIDEMNIVKK